MRTRTAALSCQRASTRLVLAMFFGLVALAVSAGPAFANHSVLVEGNCNGTGTAQRTAVTPGTCGDYDGDGRVGAAEDTDEADRVFGTINFALGPGTVGGANTGLGQNGSITIVGSGIFPESVTITGNVTLQAAPGVEAIVEAFLQGFPGGTALQAQPGIIVNAPANRYVIIRNITTRNWTSGIQVLGASRVAIDRVRAENNVNYGIEVSDSARVAITSSEVHATGVRLNPVTGNFPSAANVPSPGKGIEFDDQSTGSIFLTTVAGSFAAGISNVTGRRFAVCASAVNVFDNSPNFEPFAISCPSGQAALNSTAAKTAKKKTAKPAVKTKQKVTAKKKPAKPAKAKPKTKRPKAKARKG